MANNGDPVAQSTMGDYYNSQFNQDYEKSWHWYKKAADQNYARAQWNIGTLYTLMDSMLGDKASQTAQTLENAGMQHLIPKMKRFVANQNIDVGKAKANASKWLEKSAEQGYLDAMFFLGQMNMLNDQYEKALHWLEKANRYGHPEAAQLIEMTKMLQRQVIS